MNESKQETGSVTARKPSRHSFTLIELLVVVTIILVLVGITFKVMSLVTSKTAIARTMTVLQQVKSGLGMFYGIYGSYPPTPNGPGSVDDTTYISLDNLSLPTIYPSVSDWGLRTGLVFYLCHFGEYGQWQKYTAGLPNGGGKLMHRAEGTGVTVIHTNKVETLCDGWGRALQYQVSGDYQGYQLWSSGLNGTSEGGRGDDMGVTSQD